MLFMIELSIALVVVTVAFAVVSYIIFEEDAFFDLTDFNTLHVYLLVITLASVCSDNSVKAAWGA
jgi:hypothetical protein